MKEKEQNNNEASNAIPPKFGDRHEQLKGQFENSEIVEVEQNKSPWIQVKKKKSPAGKGLGPQMETNKNQTPLVGKNNSRDSIGCSASKSSKKGGQIKAGGVQTRGQQ